MLSRDGSLAAAPAEIAALDGLLRGQGLAARHIGDLPSLLQAFRRGDVGLLHFSCHNAFARGAPNASRILLGNQPFEPVFLEQHAGRFAAPLVFLNACRTDGQAPLYTTVEGWASSFLRAGAGAFIGSLWEVSDTSASTYAQAVLPGRARRPHPGGVSSPCPRRHPRQPRRPHLARLHPLRRPGGDDKHPHRADRLNK